MTWWRWGQWKWQWVWEKEENGEAEEDWGGSVKRKEEIDENNKDKMNKMTKRGRDRGNRSGKKRRKETNACWQKLLLLPGQFHSHKQQQNWNSPGLEGRTECLAHFPSCGPWRSDTPVFSGYPVHHNHISCASRTPSKIWNGYQKVKNCKLTKN